MFRPKTSKNPTPHSAPWVDRPRRNSLALVASASVIAGALIVSTAPAMADYIGDVFITNDEAHPVPARVVNVKGDPIQTRIVNPTLVTQERVTSWRASGGISMPAGTQSYDEEITTPAVPDGKDLVLDYVTASLSGPGALCALPERFAVTDRFTLHPTGGVFTTGERVGATWAMSEQVNTVFAGGFVIRVRRSPAATCAISGTWHATGHLIDEPAPNN